MTTYSREEVLDMLDDDLEVDDLDDIICEGSDADCMEDDLDVENDEFAVEDNDCDVDCVVQSDDDDEADNEHKKNSDLDENDDLIMTITQRYNSSNVQWTSHLKPVVVKPFTSDVGPRTILPHCNWSVSVVFYILHNSIHRGPTNLYASQCMSPESFRLWEKVCQEEMEAFFGFTMLMGLVKLSSLSDYWSKDETYHHNAIASRISRNRFIEIRRYLHFADNSTLPPPGSPSYNKYNIIYFHIIT